MATLTEAAMKLLKPFPPHYVNLAMRAVEHGKAFCPSCHMAGHMNCAHFDECCAFIEPTGDAAH